MTLYVKKQMSEDHFLLKKKKILKVSTELLPNQNFDKNGC